MSLFAIFAIVAGIIGIVGSIVPGLPGPPVSWVGLLLLYLDKGTNAAGDPMTMKFLLFWLAVTTLVTVLDYVVPAFFTRLTGGTKTARRSEPQSAGLAVPRTQERTRQKPFRRAS